VFLLIMVPIPKEFGVSPVAPVLTYFATNYQLGFGIPMLVGTVVGAISFVLALLVGPETKGKVLVPDLVVA
jgi:MFS transporter, SHS family, lactate transporter